MMAIMAKRFDQNPILSTQHIRPSQPGLEVTCVLNPGVFSFMGKTWMLLRVAERPKQRDGIVSFPVMDAEGLFNILEFEKDHPDLDLSDARLVKHKNITYLSTISHLRLMCSDNGTHFYEPGHLPSILAGKGSLETFGIEDCRVSLINEEYCLTYTQVSECGVGVGLMRTVDWQHFQRDGMILPPHNKDCALFEERIEGKYYCLHRPSGVDLGGNYIWIADSDNLTHWGNHKCIIRTRPGMWDSARVGAGASPIKTKEGWLEIYHGADMHHRYCLGAVLLDLEKPWKVLARSEEPLLEPEAPYEQNGFFGNVVFTNGHLVNGDEITMYYGASDEVICGATLSIENILDSLRVTA
jgi:predicted GH43/DUF377 family glycosyl hydrolase